MRKRGRAKGVGGDDRGIWKEKAKSGSPEAPAGARREAGIRDDEGRGETYETNVNFEQRAREVYPLAGGGNEPSWWR